MGGSRPSASGTTSCRLHVRKRLLPHLLVCTMGHMPSPTDLDPDACYRALVSHDARFDGRFFTGVTSTGIYCRTVCRVRTPQQGNCRFFALAAQAEAQGFRPCLRCRPELAPQLRHWSHTDAAPVLVQAACQIMGEAGNWHGQQPFIAWVATRLGISERHLHRVFTQVLGITPLQYWQTQRLLCAKQLLTDTALPISSVATLAGFGSVRRFNAAMQTHYRLTPGALRRQPGKPPHPFNPAGDAASVNVTLAYRPPYDTTRLLRFLEAWAIPGVEQVDIAQRQIVRTLPLPSRLLNGQGPTTQEHAGHGWVTVAFDVRQPRVHIRLDPLLGTALPQVLQTIRHWLDLDADPAEISAALAHGGVDAHGVRVPAAPVAFEWFVQTLLAQAPGCQPGSAALKQRLKVFADRLGMPVSTPHAGVVRACPSPLDVMQANPVALAEAGLTAKEAHLLATAALLWAQGALDLNAGADPDAARAQLHTLPGLTDTTVNWLLMRCLHWPDVDLAEAFAATTTANLAVTPPSATAAAPAEPCMATPNDHAARPWRSYLSLVDWAAWI